MIEIKEAIKKYNLIPKKNLGQNFLLDQNITNKIVKCANVTVDDNILEIGPGPGGLTKSILLNNPRRLTVIEQDHRCIELLNELKNYYPQLNIIYGDAIKVKEQDLVPQDTKIIANLPYNIGTLLLCKWLENVDFWQSMTLMFQKEVVERIIAKPATKEYGRLSIIAQLLCDIKWHFDLPPNVFFPPPKVTSSVISFFPKVQNLDRSIIKAIEFITKVVFNQRRKMLKTTLKQVHNDFQGLVYSTTIQLTQRPEELTVEQFIQLAKNYMRLKNEQ